MDDPLRAYEDDPVGNTVHHPYTAHCQGWDAYELGCERAECPYDTGTRKAHWWLMGWDEAQAQDDDSNGAAVLLLALAMRGRRGQR